MDGNGKVTIGNNVFFNNDCSIVAHNNIIIGNNCIFGENVKIYDHNHRFNRKMLIKSQGFSSAPITIGENCWIANSVIILKGASIGNNCVIGAGCVIDKIIPDNTIVKIQHSLVSENISFK